MSKVARGEEIMRRTGKPHITLLYGELEALYSPSIDRDAWVQAERWCQSKRRLLPGPAPMPRVPWHREFA